MRHALILAGGSGTRLWPFSTKDVPKQLVPLFGGRSLLEIAVDRALSAVPAERVWLGCGPALAEAVGRVGGLRPDRLIVEPSGRDTLPAVALGCATIAAADPEAVVAVLTVDHLIEPVAEFAAALDAAYRLAEERDAFVTFGVVPDHAATGFGWLALEEPVGDAGAKRVARFVEKPPSGPAGEMFAAGPEAYLWNSGMFVWRAATVVEAVRTHARDALVAVEDLLAGAGAARWDALTKRSVDFGIMEPVSAAGTPEIVAQPLAASWLDVGSWPSFGDAAGRDDQGNALAATTVAVDVSGCVVASTDPGHLIALIGCEDLIVAYTPAATLIVPVAQAQRVKELQALVAQQHPDRA